MTTRKCPVCESQLTGRLDKKYCSDQCRYIQNNKYKFENEQPIQSVNKVLRKNRAILKTLCPVGKATVRKDVLEAMGYDLTIFSSLFVNSKKQVYYICYDYGFTPVVEKEIEKAHIITKQPYMVGWDPWKFVKNKS